MTSSPWCIFTSAGDYSNVANWRDKTVPFQWDLITAFYGESDKEFDDLASISSKIVRAKGSKFQNLKTLFASNPTWFDGYRYIWVCDDDLVMTDDQIVHSFILSERLRCWVAQPSFNPNGKAPHKITHSRYPESDARFVSFLEVTCPLFRADKLFDFLGVYDGELIGWGIDWWLSHHFSADQNWRFAIFDCVEITNPQPEERRGGAREILKLATNDERKAQWRAVQAKKRIPELEHQTHASIKFGA